MASSSCDGEEWTVPLPGALQLFDEQMRRKLKDANKAASMRLAKLAKKKAKGSRKDPFAEPTQRQTPEQEGRIPGLLVLLDVDDTLAPTSSIIMGLYDSECCEEARSPTDVQAALLARVDSAAVAFLEALLAFASPKDVQLVTAADRDAFLTVMRHLPRLAECLVEWRVAVWTNELAEPDDEAAKRDYKQTVFESLAWARLPRLVESAAVEDLAGVVRSGSGRRAAGADAGSPGALLHMVSIGDGECEQHAMYDTVGALAGLGVAKATVVKLRDDEGLGAEQIAAQLQHLGRGLQSYVEQPWDPREATETSRDVLPGFYQVASPATREAHLRVFVAEYELQPE